MAVATTLNFANGTGKLKLNVITITFLASQTLSVNVLASEQLTSLDTLNGSLHGSKGSTLSSLQASPRNNPMNSSVAEILPPAKSGECYAKVAVPAQTRTQTDEFVLKQASSRFNITPAKFKRKTIKVQIKDASHEITAVQPEMATEVIDYTVAPKSTRWVRDSLDSLQPASAGDLAAMTAEGINTDGIAVGTCLLEHYIEDTVSLSPHQVLVSEATEKLEVIPAEFSGNILPVITKDGFSRIIEIPAVYVNKEHKVLVQPGTTEWKKGSGPIQRIDNLTGEIMCRVDIPARYENRVMEVVEQAALTTVVEESAEQEVLDVLRIKTDASELRSPVAAKFDSIEIPNVTSKGGYNWVADSKVESAMGEPTGRALCLREVPADIISYERQVVKMAGSFSRVRKPAQYKAVDVLKLVSDATAEELPIAEVVDTVSYEVQVSESQTRWQPVLCETNVTSDVITRLQLALEREGHATGGVDGKLGKGTMKAVEQFQQKNNMPTGGLTIETLSELNVDF